MAKVHRPGTPGCPATRRQPILGPVTDPDPPGSPKPPSSTLPEGLSSDALLDAITQAADAASIAVVVSEDREAGPTIVYANTGAHDLVEIDTLVGRQGWELIAPEHLEPTQREYVRRQQGDPGTPRFRTELLHGSGSRIPVEVSMGRIAIEDGRVLEVAFFFDIGDRIDAEHALRESEARMRSLIDNAPDGIVILRWPHIVFVNAAAAPMLGFSDPSEALGQDIRGRLTPVPLDTDAAPTDLDQLIAQPAVAAQFKRTVEGRDEMLLEISTIPTEHEGQPAVLAFARNVTERNAIMASMVEADKLAAIGTIAAGVAHEINNPLAYVMLNLEFLSRELPKLAEDPSLLTGIERRLVDIRQGAERVKTIVRDLQAFTRKGDEIRGPVELESVIDNAMHLARHEIRHHAKLVRRIQMAPPVHGNATRLEQLFLNLLVNAAHAVGGGDPETETIEVGVRHRMNWVEVEVRDSGCGMTQEQQAHAFDAFFTTKPQGVGTGLGLAICQGIVHSLGGEIELESELDKGTTVRVLLRPHIAARSQSSLPPPPDPAPVRGRRGRVLLVDDEVAVAESLGYAVSDHHDVDIVTSAPAARAMLSDHGDAFDVILCDLVMPGETGMELYEHVQETWPELAPRFIFMTGGAFLPRAEEFLQVVENPHIEKPFDLDTLAALLQKFVTRSALSREE